MVSIRYFYDKLQLKVLSADDMQLTNYVNECIMVKDWK